MANIDWAKTFDWSGLAAQAVELESSHRTLYREASPIRSRRAMSSGKLPAATNDFIPANGEKEAVEELQLECQKAIRLAGFAVTTEKT